MIPAPTWTPGIREYHRDPRWSSGMIRLFRRNPKLAWQRYVLGDSAAGRDSISESLIIGSAVNELLLDPAGTNLHVVDVQDRRAKSLRDAEQSFPDRTVITARELEIATRVADSVLEPATRSAELARDLLLSGHGYSEWAYRWDDEAGVPCKSLVDHVVPVHGRPGVVELKTSRNPWPAAFNRDVLKLGYHLQAAFNCRAVADAAGQEGEPIDWLLVPFWWVVCENAAPWRIAVYRMSDQMRSEGDAEVSETLSKIAAATEDESSILEPWETLEDGEIPELQTWDEQRRHGAVPAAGAQAADIEAGW